MTKTNWILAVLFIGAVLLTSCAGVDIEYSNPTYLNQQLSKIPPELLKSELVLNEDGESLFEPKFTVGEFLVYMMASQPLEYHSWFTLNVAAKEDGSTLAIRKYTKGNLVLVNTVSLTYQDGVKESRVDKIVWDDRRLGEKLDLVSFEDKLSYALMVTALFAVQ